jgi:hypothetical protein
MFGLVGVTVDISGFPVYFTTDDSLCVLRVPCAFVVNSQRSFLLDWHWVALYHEGTKSTKDTKGKKKQVGTVRVPES